MKKIIVFLFAYISSTSHAMEIYTLPTSVAQGSVPVILQKQLLDSNSAMRVGYILSQNSTDLNLGARWYVSKYRENVFFDIATGMYIGGYYSYFTYQQVSLGTEFLFGDGLISLAPMVTMAVDSSRENSVVGFLLEFGIGW
jgi:hypothetical protein